MKDVQRKFSVRYFLNLVLVDEEERRYFKQQVIYRCMSLHRSSCFSLSLSVRVRKEIVLWRKQGKDKVKNMAEQYAHFEGVTHPMKADDSVTSIHTSKQSPSNGLLSSGNNSDSPSD
jgi:hypothetical protein